MPKCFLFEPLMDILELRNVRIYKMTDAPSGKLAQ